MMNWRKSSFSGSSGSCVEVATQLNGRVVRNSNDPDGPWVNYTNAEWDAFIKGAKAGEFD